MGRQAFYTLLTTAAFAMWNMAAAFVVQAVLDWRLQKGWVQL